MDNWLVGGRVSRKTPKPTPVLSYDWEQQRTFPPRAEALA